MSKNTTKDLTQGSPLRLILGFMLPTLFGLLFQQFYNLVDTAVVGKFLGMEALAGVGSTGSINFLVLGFCSGLCSGFAIPIAQKFGEGDHDGLRRFVGNVLWLALGLALVITTAVCLLCRHIRMGELLNTEKLYARVADIVEWKNLTVVGGYKAEAVKTEDIIAYFEEFGKALAPFVCDVGLYLTEAHAQGKNIMFEAQLGAMRDIDFGIHPYTSSSSTIAAYAPIGAGVPQLQLTNSIGIMKAYSTCVGEGPFTAEYFGDKAKFLRDLGGEYGAATGRPRRVGPFDIVASRYGIRCQGATEIALTKMDVLSGYEEIEVCVAYELNGEIIHEFPFIDVLDDCKPVFKTVKGWNCDISWCRKVEDLPKEALDYVRYLEEACGCKIKYVSVGAERDAYIEMY